MNVFPLGAIDHETFMSDYWRRKPLFVKGGARALGVGLTETEYRAAAADLVRKHPELVRRGDNGLLACQNISAVEPRLGRWLVDVMREMSWTTAWVDAVYAEHDSGIGGHFDDSDNFILQQEGTKVWRLQHRDELDQERLRFTMLRSGFGDSKLSMNDADGTLLEYELEPGDLLYVPLLWGHWGVSRGRSLSISLVCNAENALGLMPLMHWVLGQDRLWWDALPVPSVTGVGHGAEQQVPPDVLATFEAVLRRLADPDIVAEVAHLWWASRLEKLRSLASARVEHAEAAST